MNKTCRDDNECPNNSYCKFDEKSMKHYCKSNSKNQLYHGCLEGDMDFKNVSGISWCIQSVSFRVF